MDEKERALLAEAEAAIEQAQAAVATLRSLMDDAPLSAEEHARLNEMIRIGLAQAARGETVDGPTSMAALKARIAARRLMPA